MRHVPTFTHAYDLKAREAYMYNHELNPQRYPLPKPREPPPDRSAGAAYWSEGVTAEDRAAFETARHGGKDGTLARKKRKTVRFASDNRGRQGKTRPAEGDQAEYGQVREPPASSSSSSSSAGPFSLAAQVRGDLSGIWTDLQTFDELPARTPVGKLRYMMTRGNRALSVLSVIGVILLVACLIGAFLYFRRPSSAAALPAGGAPVVLLGGAMPAYEDEWTRTFVPRSSAGTWTHHLS